MQKPQKTPKKPLKNDQKRQKNAKNSQKTRFLRKNRNSWPLFQRHGIAQIAGFVGNPAAVEADEGRLFGDLHDLIKFVLTGQQADVAFVITFAHQFMIAHFCLRGLFHSSFNLQPERHSGKIPFASN
ncbi:MAG: hypothetical protein AB7T27_05170 [Kiritimatiellia bacterium]